MSEKIVIETKNIEEINTFFQKKEVYGSQYNDHLLELYKLYVQTSEKLTEKRATANSFYLTITTSLVGIVGFVLTNNLQNDSYLILGLCVCGIVICIYWGKMIDNYKKLNTGKFKVIHKIEEVLPAKLFDYEWECLGRGTNPELYKGLTKVEQNVPILFIVMFGILALIEIINIVCFFIDKISFF